jgi:hypothetical protein
MNLVHEAYRKTATIFRRSTVSDPYGDDDRDVIILSKIAIDAKRHGITIDTDGKSSGGSALLLFVYAISEVSGDTDDPVREGDFVAEGEFLSLDEARTAGARIWTVTDVLDCPTIGKVLEHLEATLD